MTEHTVPGLQAVHAPPVIKIARGVIYDIILSIGTKSPETGGILLGPIGSDDVTDFFFDDGARMTGVTYSPDCALLMAKMRGEWQPAGIDMKGFVHSHPAGFESLSPGDLSYIDRLLAINPEMGLFVAPLVLPDARRLIPYVVVRERLWQPLQATVILT